MHGERLRMNWNQVLGARGRCKVTVRPYTGNDGKERQANDIDRFLEPENNQAPKWKAGAF